MYPMDTEARISKFNSVFTCSLYRDSGPQMNSWKGRLAVTICPSDGINGQLVNLCNGKLQTRLSFFIKCIADSETWLAQGCIQIIFDKRNDYIHTQEWLSKFWRCFRKFHQSQNYRSSFLTTICQTTTHKFNFFRVQVQFLPIESRSKFKFNFYLVAEPTRYLRNCVT